MRSNSAKLTATRKSVKVLYRRCAAIEHPPFYSFRSQLDWRNYASIFVTTSPCTSVSRKSRPWKRNVSRRVIQAQQMQDRRLQIVDVNAILDGGETELVGRCRGSAPA